MSAITAKTARERANIAIAFMRRRAGEAHPSTTRAFNNCLEMGDGDEVLAIIKGRIAEGRISRELVSKFLHLD